MGKVVVLAKFKDPFTRDIKIGDFITSYNKGIHRVTNIERRFRGPNDIGRQLNGDGSLVKDGEEYSALISYQQVLNGDFKPVNKGRAIKRCDAAYCSKISLDYIKEQRKIFNKQMKTLKELLETKITNLG